MNPRRVSNNWSICSSPKSIVKPLLPTLLMHLLRYLTAAVLLIKRGKNSDGRRLLKNLGHVMQNVEYTDAICEFVNCLSHKFDFEMAQQKLQECEHVLERDFFLCKQTAVFMEEARVFVFENYCRIHDKIDLVMTKLIWGYWEKS
mmetsp:Transcript_27208/g.49186  ORF Transcript_27208/g.49186 Transcript_27208/m.49186 type:complete len:145 (+) Transcript_27208:324-758(+)